METTAQNPFDAMMVSIITTIIAIVLVMVVLYLIPGIICYWKLYKKAGRGGWEAIVPFYGNIVMAQIGKKPVWIAILAVVTHLLGSGLPSDYSAVKNILFLATLALYIILLVSFFKQYTMSAGHAVLVVLLPIIAMFTLGKVQYKGALAAAPQAAAQPFAQPVLAAAPAQPQAFAAQQPTPFAPPVAPQPQQPAPQPQPYSPAPEAPVDQQNQQQ